MIGWCSLLVRTTDKESENSVLSFMWKVTRLIQFADILTRQAFEERVVDVTESTDGTHS